MGFKTRGVDTTETQGASQYFGYGEQELMINSLEVKTASTGSKKVILHMESRPIDTQKLPGFTPHEDSTNGGQIGRVSMHTAWLKDVDDENSEAHKKFIKDIGTIADKMGVRDQVDSITATEFDNYVEALNGILTGKFKFWKITVEEYHREGKSPGTSYSLGRYSKASICCANEKGKVKFNKEDAYDYKKVVPVDNTALDTASAPPKNDLPF